MSIIKRIFLFASLIFVYLILKEFLLLYSLLANITPLLGYVFIISSLGFLIYFGAIPIYSIFRMSSHNSPVKDISKIEALRSERIASFKKNPFLMESGFNLANIENTETHYNEITEILSTECALIRKRHINNLFYRTSISQNGFIDGLLILGTSIGVIKEIFTLYNGRTNNVALVSIAGKVYSSILIGGSEGVEYVSNEIYTKLV